YDGKELWSDMAALLSKAVGEQPDGATVKGISVASMGEAGLLVDAQGRALSPMIAWFDTRTQAQTDWWRKHVGQEQVYAVTGHPIHPSFGVNKLMWLRDNYPEAYSQAAHWLSAEDWILYRLSGVAATDYSIASRTMVFDVRSHTWSLPLLEKAGLRPSLMPPAYSGGTMVGTVTPQAAKVTGLAAGTPVVTGGHDHICASFAVGAFQPGALMDSTGTSESLILTTDQVITSAEMCRQNFAQECHVVGDRYGVLAGFPVSGYTVEWVNRLIEHGEVAADLGLAEAATAPPGCDGLFFLPHLRGSGSPSFDPSCRGALVGLTAEHGRAHLLRAAIEGACYELKANILALESAMGIEVLGVFAVGKVTQSELWLRSKADVTGKQLTVPRVPEAAGMGAALLAGLGAGLFRSPQEAVAFLEAPCAQVTPDAALAHFYRRQYETVYSRIYPALKELYHQLAGQTQTTPSTTG
ncbi:MAG: hypothetical protein FJ026_13365, partial [Chloroflexi bacterium]|nr:hypothetical protein [Chloroflexota bacterium]